MPVYTDHAAQQAIDDEVKECQERIRTLLTRRNSYAAISHLPNEIMAQIFTACRAESPTPRKTSRILLTISAVCSHWRHIALGAPCLWSMLSLDEAPYLTLTLARRSKSAPLTVNCPAGAYNRRDQRLNILLAILVEETHRFEDVVFHTDVTDIFSLVSLLLPTNDDLRAPLLRSLVLEAHTYASAEPPSPHMLARFWTDLRSLRTLRLRHTLPMEVAISHMPALTWLSIHVASVRTGHAHQHQLSTSWVLSILRQTPLIEHVDISTISSGDPTTSSTIPPTLSTPNSTDPIDLPLLTSLALTFTSIEDSKVVKYITFPSSTCVSLTYDNDNDDPGLQVGVSTATPSQPIQTLKGIISRLSHLVFSNTDTDTHTHTHTATDPEFIDLYMSIHEVERLDDSEFEMEVSASSVGRSRLYFVLQRFPSSTRRHANLVGALQLDRIRDLTLYGLGEEDVVGWCGVLSSLVNLKSMMLDRVGVLRGLAPSTASSSTSNSNITSTSTNSHLPTPDLKTLVIHQDPTATPEDWSTFIQTCRLRSHHSAPKLDIKIHVRDNDVGDEDDDWERVRSGSVDVDVEGLSRYAKIEFEWEEDEE
ncbi:hypothetical protein ONZ45_g6638 [Pleurotus djamor]|nr:hypothetical protein ONZ45_g6638 [Pleurotus djamor]